MYPNNDYRNYLMHHGILGQRWGIRRYQSYDTTGPRKGGKTGKEIGNLSRKKGQKKLNELDSKRAVVERKLSRQQGRESKAEYKLEKAKKSKKYEKIEKASRKLDKAHKAVNNSEAKLDSMARKTQSIVSNLESSGKFKVTTSSAFRFTSPKVAVMAAALLSTPVFAAQVSTRTMGTKFKVRKI